MKIDKPFAVAVALMTAGVLYLIFIVYGPPDDPVGEESYGLVDDAPAGKDIPYADMPWPVCTELDYYPHVHCDVTPFFDWCIDEMTALEGLSIVDTCMFRANYLEMRAQEEYLDAMTAAADADSVAPKDADTVSMECGP
jgi:hypothetical protein